MGISIFLFLLYNLLAMNGEFNDLSTNNVNVTFNSKPNNTQLSDELEADPIYTRKMGTAYSINKRVRTSIIVLSSTLIIAGGALSIMNNFSFHNAYIGSLPTLTNLSIKVDEEVDSLHYSFDISNKGALTVYFVVSNDEISLDAINVTETGTYEGTIDNLGYEISYEYEIFCTNSIDYRKTLTKGSFVTFAEK